MTYHNRRVTNYKIALLFDRNSGSILWISGSCARLSNPKANLRPDPGSLPSASVLDWLRDTWPRLKINLIPFSTHPVGLSSCPLPRRTSSLPPATALANHRSNLTQPSRNRSDPPSLRFPLIFPRLITSLFLHFVALSFFFTPSNKHCLRDDRSPSSNET